jgi:hypothetical protein
MNDDFLDNNKHDNWDDFNEDEEGESWKPNLAKVGCKTLSIKWEKIIFMLKGVLDADEKETETEGEELFAAISGFDIGDAYEISAKLRGAAAADMYSVYMENACIIRRNAQSIKSSMLLMIGEEQIEEEHGLLIRTEIDEFRILFKEWVSHFQKDEYEDEWGLFI